MITRIEDRLTRPAEPKQSRKPGDDSAPKAPDVDKPAPSNPLMDRMRKVDPDQAKKYRQRSGE